MPLDTKTKWLTLFLAHKFMALQNVLTNILESFSMVLFISLMFTSILSRKRECMVSDTWNFNLGELSQPMGLTEFTSFAKNEQTLCCRQEKVLIYSWQIGSQLPLWGRQSQVPVSKFFIFTVDPFQMRLYTRCRISISQVPFAEGVW